MSARDLIAGLFNGEGALPEPSPEELRDLEGVVESFSSLTAPTPGKGLPKALDEYLDAHCRTTGLFSGDQPQPRPTPEEEEELGRTLAAFKSLSTPSASDRIGAGVKGYLQARARSRELLAGWEEGHDPEVIDTLTRLRSLNAPPASPRVAGRVRRYLAARNRLRQRAAAPTWPVLADLRQAIGESRLLKALAAGLLIQALAIPVTAAISAYRFMQEQKRVSPPLEFVLEPGEPIEPIEPLEYRGGADHIHLDDPRGYALRSSSDSDLSLEVENSLRLRWQALTDRVRPTTRLQRLRDLGGPLAVDHLVGEWCRKVAAELPTTQRPYDLALGVRALVLAGNTPKVGPLAAPLRQAVSRLGRAWKGADPLSRIQIAAAFTELNLLTGGAEQQAAKQAIDWCLDWVATPANLEGVSPAALADLAEILEWTPLLLPRLATSQRLLLRRQLESRIEQGGTAGEEAAAALLRAFPGSPRRTEALRMTLFLRRNPLEKASDEPWTLVHLAWGLFPPSGLWADFNLALRSASCSVQPRTLRERALWVMALTVFYSAPEEH